MNSTEKKIHVFRGLLTAIEKEYSETYITVRDIIELINIITNDEIEEEELACTLFSIVKGKE